MNGFLSRFLSFDKMITGSIIKILYYILLVIVCLTGIFFTLQGLFTGNFSQFFLGLIGLPLAIIYVRILCEMMIVIFRISDNLAALRKMKEGEETSSTFS